MESKNKIGILGAIGIIAGNMIGPGIALLPTSFATIGSVTLLSWLITLVGILALAYVFCYLGLVDPQKGGPVTYAKKLSPILGFQTGILYWLAHWVGNLAVAVAGVEYLSIFYPPLTDPLIGGIATILVVWIFTCVNFFGTVKVAKIVTITVLLMLIPVVGVAIFGWGHFSDKQFYLNWNVSNMKNSQAIFSGIILAIWSFIGIETVSVGAHLVKRPRHTIPFATIIGTSLAAIAYILSTTAMFGMFSASQIAQTGAPFSLAFAAIVGNWAESIVSFVIAFSCLASLASWMMIVSQASAVAASHNTLPSIFAKMSEKNKIPIYGLIINASLMTLLMIILMIFGYVKKQGVSTVFFEIVSMSVVLTLFPYIYSSIFMIKVVGITKRSIFHFIISLFAIALCFIAFAGAKEFRLVITLIVAFTCFILYALNKSKKFEKG